MHFFGKQVGVLGMGRSGIAAARKIRELGGTVLFSDTKTRADVPFSSELSTIFNCEFGGHTDKLLHCDLIVISPGIPDNIPILKKAVDKGIEIISEIELGYRIKSEDSKIIAITGSNGKSTTTSLIYHILQTAGYNALLAGNIGDAFTKFPIDKPGYDFIVLEISSFQLEKIRDFKPDVSVMTNITPDHLNRYDTFEDYVLAKFNIYKNQTEDDLAIINAEDHVTMGCLDKIKAEKKIFSIQQKTDCHYNNIFISMETKHGYFYFDPATTKLVGKHSVQNMMCALLAVSRLNINKNTLKTALETFVPLAHRLEPVAEINKRKFYNDSKATNTDSVKYALQAFKDPIRVIMGGSDKGEDFSVLAPYISANIIGLYLIGETAPKLRLALESLVTTYDCPSLKDAVHQAYSESSEGDVILLSPACASYDMFRNFEDRGNQFKIIVENLHKTEINDQSI